MADLGGPLIRWTVMLALGAAGAAYARYLTTDEANGRAETGRQAAPRAPAVRAATPASDLDASLVDENGDAPVGPELEAAAVEEEPPGKSRRRGSLAASASDSIPAANYPTAPAVDAGLLPLPEAVPSTAEAAVADPLPPSASSSSVPTPADEPPPAM